MQQVTTLPRLPSACWWWVYGQPTKASDSSNRPIGVAMNRSRMPIWSVTVLCSHSHKSVSYNPDKATLMSVGLFLVSEGMEDQLSLRKEEEVLYVSSIPELEMGIEAAGIILMGSGLCFFVFCSCWLPTRKLPITI